MVNIFYGDLWLITFIPIIIQSTAAFYGYKIRYVFGRKISTVFTILNGSALSFDIVITYLIFRPPETNTAIQQPIEWWGIFIVFIVPFGIAISLFILQKTLKDVLEPIGGLGGKK